jgi:hypothetical protein
VDTERRAARAQLRGLEGAEDLGEGRAREGLDQRCPGAPVRGFDAELLDQRPQAIRAEGVEARGDLRGGERTFHAAHGSPPRHGGQALQPRPPPPPPDAHPPPKVASSEL